MQTILSPKMLSSGHFLTKELDSSAQSFKLGTTTLKLSVRAGTASGLVARIPLKSAAADRLKRKENEVEAAAAPIDDPATIAEIRGFLGQLGASKTAADGLEFFVVTARRRKPEVTRSTRSVRIIRPGEELAPALPSPEHIQIGRQVPVASTANFVLALDLKPKKRRVLIIPEGRQVWIDLILPGGFAGATDDEGGDHGSVDTSTDQTNADFAECYSECMENVPEWLLAIVSGTCVPCAGIVALAVAAAAGTAGGATAPAAATIALVCAPCAVSVGVVLGSCLLTCHELLGKD